MPRKLCSVGFKRLALMTWIARCAYIMAIEDNLNNRPKKTLGYQTPLEAKFWFEALRFDFESAPYRSILCLERIMPHLLITF